MRLLRSYQIIGKWVLLCTTSEKINLCSDFESNLTVSIKLIMCRLYDPARKIFAYVYKKMWMIVA